MDPFEVIRIGLFLSVASVVIFGAILGGWLWHLIQRPTELNAWFLLVLFLVLFASTGFVATALGAEAIRTDDMHAIQLISTWVLIVRGGLLFGGIALLLSFRRVVAATRT